MRKYLSVVAVTLACMGGAHAASTLPFKPKSDAKPTFAGCVGTKCTWVKGEVVQSHKDGKNLILDTNLTYGSSVGKRGAVSWETTSYSRQITCSKDAHKAFVGSGDDAYSPMPGGSVGFGGRLIDDSRIYIDYCYSRTDVGTDASYEKKYFNNTFIDPHDAAAMD